MNDVARILDRVQQGDPKAAEELLPLVYEELRKLAAHKMANEASGQTLQATGHTLQPTAPMHEAWLDLEATGGGISRTPRVSAGSRFRGLALSRHLLLG